MNLVIFIHQDSCQKGIVLKEFIKKYLNGVETDMLHTFNMLRSRLQESSECADKEIFVLLAESKKRLGELASLIELLENKRIILIIPDDSKESVSKASQFFPRFFTSVSNNYDDLCSVLNKMIKQTNIIKHNNVGGDNVRSA